MLTSPTHITFVTFQDFWMASILVLSTVEAGILEEVTKTGVDVLPLPCWTTQQLLACL